jgi:hypothetical protein
MDKESKEILYVTLLLVPAVVIYVIFFYIKPPIDEVPEGFVRWQEIEQESLNQNLLNKPQKFVGYIKTIKPEFKSKEFLLTKVAASCPFCLPPEIDEIIFVQSPEYIEYTDEPIYISGLFKKLEGDQVLYILENAQEIKN